jgi:branched-chain amino acid aminotransferase
MVNCNGNIQESSSISIDSNRGFLYGDSIFETIKVVDNKVLFLEDHYFRLMASMRICRMEIPMNFTMEYFETQISNLISTFSTSNSYRVRFSVYRDSEGFYLPKERGVRFFITASPLSSDVYVFSKKQYEVELFKDFFIPKQLLSTLKTNNKMLQITGSIFANENGYDNCLVLNDEKNVKYYRSTISAPQLTIYDYTIYIEDTKDDQDTKKYKTEEVRMNLFLFSKAKITSLELILRTKLKILLKL